MSPAGKAEFPSIALAGHRISPSSSTTSSNKIRLCRGKSAPLERSPQLSVIGSPAPRSSVPASRSVRVGLRAKPHPPDHPWTPHKVLRDTWVVGDDLHSNMSLESPHYENDALFEQAKCLEKVVMQSQVPLKTFMKPRPYSSSFLHSSLRILQRKNKTTLKTNKIQSTVIKNQSSSTSSKKTSLTSSSAGDAGSVSLSPVEEDCQRPPAPSPPSSDSHIPSSEHSLNGSSAISSDTTSGSENKFHNHNNKYSFPIPPLVLSKSISSKLQSTRISTSEKSSQIQLKSVDTSLEAPRTRRSSIFYSSSVEEISDKVEQQKCLIEDVLLKKPMPKRDTGASSEVTVDQSQAEKTSNHTSTRSFTDIDLTLIDIQDRILQLVDSQQACTRTTWLTMQRLSASLDQLTVQPSPSAPTSCSCPHAGNLPPPVLLLEAAGCARRLAEILTLFGAAPQCKTPAESSPPPPPLPHTRAPTACELQLQKSRLRRVQPPSEGREATGGMAAALGAVIARRRYSVAPDDVSTGWDSDEN